MTRSPRTDVARATAWGLFTAALVLAVVQWRAGQPVITGVAAVLGVAFGWWYFATDELPPELVGSAPYVVTLLVLALASQRLRPPKADGKIYRRGEGA